MMKHVLTVQDLSCVGRCSLSVAMPTLSAMGIRCSVLPTAVLSTHTAFPNPEVVSLTENLEAFADHWEKQGITFDAISVGYLSEPAQAEAVAAILDRFSAPVVLDPVMGDNGRLYSRITEEHLNAVRGLCEKADVLLPNLTEAAFLTGLPYRENPDEDYLKGLCRGLLALGTKAAVITGIGRPGGQIGFYGTENGGGDFSYRAGFVPRKFHGTGDLFAAVFTGSLVRGESLHASGAKAAEFVRRCVLNTEEVTPHGVEFEKELPWLMGGK